MSVTNASKGRRGEDIAAACLAQKGYRILERNYRRMRCEVDIIAAQGDVLVFVEVKARSSSAMGLGRESVTAAKQKNIITAAQCYIAERELQDTAGRFDVVEVDLSSGRINHIINAFEV